MEIGRLNKRITFLENRVKIDEIGNHTSKWDEYYSCWAEVRVKSSEESADAGVTKDVQRLECKVRQNQYTRSVTSNTHRILFRGSEYNIISTVPFIATGDYIVFTCEVRKAGAADDFY